MSTLTTEVTKYLYSSPTAASFIKLLHRGTLFKRHIAPDSAFPQGKVEWIFIIFVNNESNLRGTLYWKQVSEALANQRDSATFDIWRSELLSSMNDTPNCLMLKTISDIFVGKHTALFKSELKNESKSDLCFSLASKRIVLDMEAESKESRDKWLRGIHKTLMTVGKKKNNDHDKSHRKSHATSSSNNNSHTLSVLQKLKLGSAFKRYVYDENTDSSICTNIYLVLKQEPVSKFGKMGSLVWCPLDEKNTIQDIEPIIDTNCLPLMTFTDLFMKKQTKAFKSKGAENADPNNCFTFGSKTVQLNLEGVSKEHIQEWFLGVHKLLQRGGRISSDTKSTDSPRTSIASSESTDQNNNTSTQVSATAQDRTSKALVACKRLLTKGANFSLYFVKKKNEKNQLIIGKESIFCFYKEHEKIDASELDQGKDNLGCLYWCAPGQKDESPKRRLWLHQIIEMSLGKQTDALKGVTGKGSSKRCFSLYTKKSTLSLEAQSAPICDAWLKAIHFVLTNSGRKAQKHQSNNSNNKHDHLTTDEDTLQSNKVSRAEIVRKKMLKKQQRTLKATKERQKTLKQSSKESDEKNNSNNNDMKNNTNNNSSSNTTTSSSSSIVSEPDQEYGISLIDPVTIFKIISKIGEGSYGSVYRGLDTRSNSEVAIKIVRCEGGQILMELQKEINILQRCSSENIVSYKGTFQKGNYLWIVMEYCGAGSLFHFMTVIAEQTFSEEQIASIMKMCLVGLSYLHSTRRIHRDLKAGNILCTSDGVCKLADFGVSAEMSGAITRNKTVIGTPHWMAPEVLLYDEGYDEKADIWSLGITAIELALGEPPHSNVHPMRAIAKIPTSPSPTLPEPEKWSNNFHDFLSCALNKSATERYSAEKLLQHPFITKAKGNDIIKTLITPYIPEIESSHEPLHDSIMEEVSGVEKLIKKPDEESHVLSAITDADAKLATEEPKLVSYYKEAQNGIDVAIHGNMTKEELEKLIVLLDKSYEEEKTELEKVYHTHETNILEWLSEK